MAALIEFPREMKKGSKGPHITVLQSFLCGAFPASPIAGQMVYDEEFGEVTEELVREFQVRCQVSVSCVWDMPTRGAARRDYNFDFEAACNGIQGTTVFVQADGTKIHWGRTRG